MHKRALKIISFFITVVIFLSANTALAANLEGSFVSLALGSGLDPNIQSFCLANAEGNILSSQNVSTMIIPASVSKIYTFDFALATLGKDFRYTTNFVLKDTTLYINGGGDPHFVIDHLALILKQIHDAEGVTVSKFVFSPNFFFNWQSTPKAVQAAMIASLKNKNVVYSTTAYTGAGTKYQFKSAPLIPLMKQINDYSTNVAADTLFAKAGGAGAFTNYMQTTYGVGKDVVAFGTGSGLKDNYTTCDLTLRVIKHFEQSLHDIGFEITDVMSVPRVDPGVLSKRLLGLSDTSGIVAKSGSVNYRQNLAGIINTKKGPLYFAIFATYPKLAMLETTKHFVDTFTEAVVTKYRQVSFNYVVPVDQLIASVVVAKIRN